MLKIFLLFVFATHVYAKTIPVEPTTTSLTLSINVADRKTGDIAGTVKLESPNFCTSTAKVKYKFHKSPTTSDLDFDAVEFDEKTASSGVVCPEVNFVIRGSWITKDPKYFRIKGHGFDYGFKVSKTTHELKFLKVGEMSILKFSIAEASGKLLFDLPPDVFFLSVTCTKGPVRQDWRKELREFALQQGFKIAAVKYNYLPESYLGDSKECQTGRICESGFIGTIDPFVGGKMLKEAFTLPHPYEAMEVHVSDPKALPPATSENVVE